MKQIIEEILKIEREAKKLGIPFSHICKKANVNNSTTQRWRSGYTEPLFSKWNDFLKAYQKLKEDKQNA